MRASRFLRLFCTTSTTCTLILFSCLPEPTIAPEPNSSEPEPIISITPDISPEVITTTLPSPTPQPPIATSTLPVPPPTPTPSPVTPRLIMPPPTTPESVVVVPVQSDYVHSHYCSTPYAPVPHDDFAPHDPTQILIHIQHSFGNTHFGYLGFDFTNLPLRARQASLRLYCLENHESFITWTPSVGLTLRRMTEPWQWDTLQPACNDALPVHEWVCNWFSVPCRDESWAVLDITDTYNNWQSGYWPNYGIRLEQLATLSNSWTKFASERYLDPGKRPQLIITPQPLLELKLPLPGNRGWLLTTEAGGVPDCASSWEDVGHQGKSFYALDFAPISYRGYEAEAEIEVPVLAAADGTIAEVDDPAHAANGHYVVINHSWPANTARDVGICSLYLHLAEPSPWQVGQEVRCGDQIGIMGNTGPYSRGRHLHFEVQRNGQGEAEAAMLSQVMLENRRITDYHVECENGERVTYYWSSNRP